MGLLALFFCASAMSAQEFDKTVKPYPFTEEGQILTINSTNSQWELLMEASTITRNTVQSQLDGGQNPTAIWSCVGNVCCKTEAVWCGIHNKYHYTTNCINTTTGEEFDKIEQ